MLSRKPDWDTSLRKNKKLQESEDNIDNTKNYYILSSIKHFLDGSLIFSNDQ